MDGEQLDQEAAQQAWNEEAAKLDSDSDVAFEAKASAQVGDDSTQDFPELDEPGQEPQPEDQPSAPQSTLPPEVMAALAEINQLKQANAQLLHHVKTAEGRVSAMQREFQQARVAQQTVAPNQAPSQGQVSAAAKNPEKWDALKQDFPEWAGAMEEYVASKIGSQTPQQPQLTAEQVAGYVREQVSQTRTEMARAIEEARIEGKYENWRDTVNTTEFVQWFTVQSPEIRGLADSAAARDALRMLDLFSEAKKRSATDIRQERGQRLAAAATTRPGQTPPPKTMGDMSPEELWNYEAAKREKTRQTRGY